MMMSQSFEICGGSKIYSIEVYVNARKKFSCAVGFHSQTDNVVQPKKKTV